MKFLPLTSLFLTLSSIAFGQTGGTVTGTVSDTTGSLIPGVQITVTNPNTGTKFDTVTTSTGNFTVPGVPVGSYYLQAEHAGFSKYEAKNLDVQLAVTTRVDVIIKVGSTTDSVEVTAESSLLKTENAEQETTLSGKQIAELPINFGIGAGAIRNPLSFIQLTPGATFNGWNNISINGGSNNFNIMFEGQESASAYQNQVSDEEQPSVEAVEQFTLQTSNFAAEFGLIGTGGLYNFTSKSGTNNYHGSIYDYFENTFLNAGIPFTGGDFSGGAPQTKVVKHLDDYGFSVGGPLSIFPGSNTKWVPRFYNGKNKTFFFFNLEKYRDREFLYDGIDTVPNQSYLNGDLSNNLLVTSPPNRNLGTSFAGQTLIQNTIYDPNTAVINSAGQRVLTPFPGNIIPLNRINPVSAQLLKYFPAPNIGTPDQYVNNYSASGAFFKLQYLPSIKIDQNIGDKRKISGYFAEEATDKSNGVDGLPAAISQVRDQYIRYKTVRLNYDETVSPTLLFHFGAGFEKHRNPDTDTVASTGFCLTCIGITGAPGTGFPRISGIGDSTYGGMQPAFGPNSRVLAVDSKPVGTGSLTWVHGNHSIKGGFDWKIDQQISDSSLPVSPAFSFSSSETAQPLYGQVLPSGTGLGSGWASFLLGLYDGGSVGNAILPTYRRTSWALFVQDTWKITRKLTLDYGLRWDLQQALRETHGRETTFGFAVPNENANGISGGYIYDGSGAGRCNCNLIPSYPYAVAPRIGLAYQINAKTVLRAGWGLSYGQLAFTASQPSTTGTGFNTINFNAQGNGVGAGVLGQPLPNVTTAGLYSASYDPGNLLIPGASIGGALASNIDRNGGRPPRVSQWNISLQREIVKDVVVEAAFVGNKGAWLNEGTNMISYDAVSPATLNALGLGDLTNAATRTLLSSSITSAAAVAAGFKLPYPSFPTTGTVLQSLRPFPQYSSIGSLWAPLGDSWYDAGTLKVTKRFSHGLVASFAYAFSKAEDSTVNAGSIYNRASFKGLAATDLPNVISLSVDYNIPVPGYVKNHKILDGFLSNWRLGSIDTWQSGPLLTAPGSSNSIGSYVSTGYTYQVRVPGVPLYLVDINCGCIDPTKQQVLNPAAWVNQAAGVPGSNIRYYNDFRGQRRPVTSASLGKIFPIKERAKFSIRAEFFNILNQDLALGNPSTSSPGNPLTFQNGLITGGFGTMNYTGLTSNSVNSTLPTPRTGQLVARFDF